MKQLIPQSEAMVLCFHVDRVVLYATFFFFRDRICNLMYLWIFLIKLMHMQVFRHNNGSFCWRFHVECLCFTCAVRNGTSMFVWIMFQLSISVILCKQKKCRLIMENIQHLVLLCYIWVVGLICG